MIDIERGRYKNISIRVKDDGKIVVKAPKRVSDSFIEDFINKKSHWINLQLKKVSDMTLLKSKYDFNKHCYIFDKAYVADSKTKFYQQAFNDYIITIANDLSNKYNLKFCSLKLANSRRIWGSLDSKKTMKLNWKLVILPKDLAIYVIVHELCHIIEFNHSKIFWLKVESILPNYKTLRKELKRYSFLLNTKVL